jgi:preprotein translocase subunit SecE
VLCERNSVPSGTGWSEQSTQFVLQYPFAIMDFLKKYIQQVVQELKKVTWPTKEQTIEKTVLVIVVSGIVALYIGGIDLILQAIMKSLIK